MARCLTEIVLRVIALRVVALTVLVLLVLAAAWVAAPQRAVACSCGFTGDDAFPPADSSDVPRNVVVVLDLVEYDDARQPRLCRDDGAEVAEVEAEVTVERSPKVLSEAFFWNSGTYSENVRYTIKPREPLLARRRHVVGFGSDCAEIVAWGSSMLTSFSTGDEIDTEAPPAIQVVSSWMGHSDATVTSCGREFFEWIELKNAAALSANLEHLYFEVCARLDATEEPDCWRTYAPHGYLTIGVVACGLSWLKFGSTTCGDDQRPFEYTLTAYDAAGNRSPTTEWLAAGFGGSPMTREPPDGVSEYEHCEPGFGAGCAAEREPAVGAVALAYGAFALLFALRRRGE